MRYLVIIEKGEKNYGAYIPDLPGCITVGKTVDEVKKHIQEAADLHVEGMLKDGDAIPEPMSIAAEVDVNVNRPA